MAGLAEGSVEQSARADVLKVEDGCAVRRARVIVRDHLEKLPRGEVPCPRRMKQVENLQPGRMMKAVRGRVKNIALRAAPRQNTTDEQHRYP